MSAKRFGSVWDALEVSPAKAEGMKLRSLLMLALTDHLEREHLTKASAAKVLGVTPPCISDLLQGKIERFDLDLLIKMLASAGFRVTIQVDKAA